MEKLIAKKSITNIFFKLFIVSACFESFGAWMFVIINETIIHICVLLMSFLFFLLFPDYYRFKRKTTTWFLLLILAIFVTVYRLSFFGQLDKFSSVIPFLFIFSLKDEYKSDILNFVVNFVGYSFAISLFFFFLYNIGISLPHSYFSVFHYEFDNYYFFYIRINFLNILLPVSRYCFIFYEPGYTGCLIALLLHAISYNFKKYKISYILLLALFLTFSLAGWLIASLGFLLHKLGNNKLRFYWVSLILIFLLAFVSFFKSYNGGDNIVNNVMLERLQASETEYTIISGYNRSSASLREYFWNDFLYSENIWLGRPDYLHYFGYEETMISDWTAFVIRHGWIGLVSFILFVVYYPLCSHKKKYALTTYSILYLLIFSQTIFLVFGYMYLTVYSLGCSEIMNENSKVNIAN